VARPSRSLKASLSNCVLSCREEVPCLHNGNPVLAFLSPPRPCASANIAESSSRHLQFLGQLLNLSVANTPPFLLFRGRSTAGVTSPLFRVDFVGRWSCRTISFSSETRLSNWRAELPQKACVTWLDGNGIINGGRENGAVALRLRMSA
jgi:hypothetical protein